METLNWIHNMENYYAEQSERITKLSIRIDPLLCNAELHALVIEAYDRFLFYYTAPRFAAKHNT